MRQPPTIPIAAGMPRWYGFRLSFDDPELVSEQGVELFTPNVGDLLLEARLVFVERWVQDSDIARLALLLGDSAWQIDGSGTTWELGTSDLQDVAGSDLIAASSDSLNTRSLDALEGARSDVHASVLTALPLRATVGYNQFPYEAFGDGLAPTAGETLLYVCVVAPYTVDS